jgi:hypothetical protein
MMATQTTYAILINMSSRMPPTQKYIAYFGAFMTGIVSMIAAATASSYVPHIYLPHTILAAYVAMAAVELLILALGMAAYVRLELGPTRTGKAVLGAVAVVIGAEVVLYLALASLITRAPGEVNLWSTGTGIILAGFYIVGFKTATVLAPNRPPRAANRKQS